MDFNLYTLLVNQLIGGYWLTVLVLMAFIFLLMGVLGKMSKLTVMYYEALFFMAMCIGSGYTWLATLVGFAILVFVYLQFKNLTSG